MPLPITALTAAPTRADPANFNSKAEAFAAALTGLVTEINGLSAADWFQVLGTVSETGGVPDGALFEEGSNANGEYMRLANGWQICTAEISIDALAVTTTAGALYRSAPVSHSFPAAFVGKPFYTDAAFLGSDNTTLRNAAINVNPERGGSSTWPDWDDIILWSSSSVTAASGEMTVFKLIAVGRWFT